MSVALSDQATAQEPSPLPDGESLVPFLIEGPGPRPDARFSATPGAVDRTLLRYLTEPSPVIADARRGLGDAEMIESDGAPATEWAPMPRRQASDWDELPAPHADAEPIDGPHLAGTIQGEHHSSLPASIPSPVDAGRFSQQLAPCFVRADQIPNAPSNSAIAETARAIVPMRMWWDDALASPLGLSPQMMSVDIATLTHITLRSSPYVQGLLTEPQIRRSDLVIADADFDTTTFVKANFADTNEPVGSALTTGDNSDRFLDNTFTSAAGLRRRTRRGASLEMVQRGGYQDNNSTFLIPNPQGTTRLEINFTQPLMKDGGKAVNHTQVLLARIDVSLAENAVREELEKHLVSVTRAYWELYQSRAEWLQRHRLLEGATRLRDVLADRGSVDSLQRQILRAQAAAKSRRSDLVRAETRIRNAQSKLRLLTGSPELIQASRWELTPQDRPLAAQVDVSPREATIAALSHRPDVVRSLKTIESVSARVGAARNQVLPRLDLILSTYVAGLDDKTDVFGAFAKQFSEGRPSYAAGMLFEVPLGNRANKARLTRDRWELTRAMCEFRQTTEVVFTEVEIAVRETETTFNEMVTKKQSVEAADREVEYLQQRWELLPDPGESAVRLIEDLLDAQERLADEERDFVTAQVAYALSWVQLRRAMGVLLRFDDVPPVGWHPGSTPSAEVTR